MHSLSPYTIRVFDNSLSNKAAEKYHKLDKVGSFDIYKLLKEFIGQCDKLQKVSKKQFIFRFEDVVYDVKTRVIYGWLNFGKYGSKHALINTENGKTDYTKQAKHADMTKHFFHIALPKGRDEGVILFHSFRGHGIKSYFYDYFNAFFKKKTQLNILMNPLSNAKALKEWEKAQTKEIRLMKFKGAEDLTDRIKGLGHIQKFFTMKPPRKSSFGMLKEISNKKSELYSAIEIFEPLCESVKVVVKLGVRTRTFNVGTKSSNTVCEIDAPEGLELEDGHPKPDAILNWFSEVSEEHLRAIRSQ